MTMVDNAVYVDGLRTDNPKNLDETYEVMRERGGMAWIGLYRPGLEELRSVAEEFSLHELAVEDAINGHQRAKIERYGDTLFTVLRPARYLDDVEKVQFGELHVFVGPDFVVTVRHAESPNLAKVRHRMEAAPDLLRLGPEAVLYAILDEVVDEYAPVVAGLENDIDEIEDQLFERRPGGVPAHLRAVPGGHRVPARHPPAARHAGGSGTRFEKYGLDLELQRRLRDVHDHIIRVVERVDAFRVLLQNALTVNATLVAQQQNEEMQSPRPKPAWRRTRRSRRSQPGRRSCSPRPWSEPSTG